MIRLKWYSPKWILLILYLCFHCTGTCRLRFTVVSYFRCCGSYNYRLSFTCTFFLVLRKNVWGVVIKVADHHKNIKSDDTLSGIHREMCNLCKRIFRLHNIYCLAYEKETKLATTWIKIKCAFLLLTLYMQLHQTNTHELSKCMIKFFTNRDYILKL